MRRRMVAAVLALVALVATALPAGAQPPHGATAGSTVATATVGAVDAWEQGLSGDGVGIALIDTGVSPRPGLPGAFQQQVSLVGPGRATDGHGHGTFMAGLMVGEGDATNPLGIAPGADLWSVKVGDADGRTTIPQVLAGLALVREHADELGIRVLLLALGEDLEAMPSPLEMALEQLWAEGIVVVVASGNEGHLTSPGASPYLITVGAFDDAGSLDRADHTPVDWSGRGAGRDGQPKPDVLAPGASVVSVRVPGSTADRENPDSRIGGQRFRGSGSSMAAAVTAASVALLLEAHPDLAPDEVKGRLTATSQPLTGSDVGTLDVAAAIATPAAPANTHLPALELLGDPIGWEAPSWSDGWSNKSWLSNPWFGVSWQGEAWIGESWSNKSWLDESWANKSWLEDSWDNKSWLEDSWDNKSWLDEVWQNKSWLTNDWAVDGWQSRSWLSASF